MTVAARPVLIAGGGIGGLSAAIALARAGLDVQVLERSSFAEESGAGIQLGPNATRLLDELGVLDMIAPSAFRPEAIWLFDGLSGQKLATIPLGHHVEQRYGAPYLTSHRADLHAGLRVAAAELATLTADFDVAGLETRDDTVVAASIEGAMIEGASLIGADGLWSTVRRSIMPDAALAFSGATAFRSVLRRDALQSPFSAPVVGLWLGPRAHLVHYPVRGGDALNVVAITEGGRDTQGWNQSADVQALQAGFTRWCKDSKSLIDQAEGWRSWSLYRLAGLPYWSRGPVTLLGDAAHPVLPYLAQGAALAIEDAVKLAQCLQADPHSIAAAFRAYEAARRPRATQLQRTSRRFGWMYHLRGAARLARNFTLRHRKPVLSRFDWLYGET